MESVQNISRCFTDMRLFRVRVVNKEQCEQSNIGHYEQELLADDSHWPKPKSHKNNGKRLSQLLPVSIEKVIGSDWIVFI